MKLFELKVSADSGRHALEHDGYKLHQEVEYDYGDDGRKENAKIFHYITVPGKKEEVVDHSPYENIDANTLKAYASFHKKHGRFPTRKDINSIGPLHNKDVEKLA